MSAHAPLRFRIRPEIAGACAAGRTVATPEVNTLTLLIAMRCNAACRHCAFRSHPGRTEAMDMALASRLVEEARAAFPRLVMISLSGGEPMLASGMVQALVARAQACGLCSALVTNAYWATSRARALRVLEPLRSRGLIDLTTSLDAFHARFVPSASVRHAAAAARALGMRVHINVSASDDPRYRAENVPELLRLPRAHFEGPDAITVAEFVPTAAGFARNARIAPRVHARGADRQGCLSVIRAPAVDTRGDFYACCGVGGATDFGPGRLFRVGNVHEQPLRGLAERLRNDLLYRLIAAIGPAALLETALREAGLRPPDPGALAGSPCRACHILHGSRRAQEATRALLAKLAATRGKERSSGFGPRRPTRAGAILQQ